MPIAPKWYMRLQQQVIYIYIYIYIYTYHKILSGDLNVSHITQHIVLWTCQICCMGWYPDINKNSLDDTTNSMLRVFPVAVIKCTVAWLNDCTQGLDW
jgi:hypothetical protein